MRTLVVFFSRTGTTKKAAEAIAAKLEADLEAVTDKTNWSGPIGFIKGGRAAMKGKSSGIDAPKNDPGGYDLVVIGSPVWAGRITPAIRAYLEKFGPALKRVAFFTTQGGANRQKIFDDYRGLVPGLEPAAELMLLTKTVAKGEVEEAITEFCRKLG